MIITAVVAALLGAIIGFFAAGSGAATALVSALGSRDGGPAMSGFFGFGPIGAIAGALLGVGLVLRFGRGSPAWSKSLTISAGIVAALGGLLLAVSISPDRGPIYSNVIEFQLEYPSTLLVGVDIPSADAMWGAAGADLDDNPISQFSQKTCDGDLCILQGSIAAMGPMSNFRVATRIGQKKFRYLLGLPTVIAPVDWSEWHPGDGARVRWRIVKR